MTALLFYEEGLAEGGSSIYPKEIGRAFSPCADGFSFMGLRFMLVWGAPSAPNLVCRWLVDVIDDHDIGLGLGGVKL
jgi:hypothetical protein